MSDTKISEAAVEAAWTARAHALASGEVIRPDWMRAALEAALPYLHPQPAELAEQQGVQEPVAWKYRAPGVSFWRVSFHKPVNSEWECEPLYAAPPAQGIDLGQFREAVAYWLNMSRARFGKGGEHSAKEAERLLALIDQRDKEVE